MKKLTAEQVLTLHHMLADATGGDVGVRDYGLLESALEAPFSTFGGTDLYPTLLEKAARLGFSLIANHAFLDGNKRIGVLVMLTFLQLNGAPVHTSNEAIVTLGLSVASGAWKYPEILDFLRRYTA